MTNQPLNETLSSTLQTHAAALQPEFSPLLHHRIIARLRQEACSGGAAPLAGTRFRLTWRWPAAAILALAGALWVFSILNAAHEPSQIVKIPPAPIAPSPDMSLPSLPPVQTLLQTAVNPTRAKLEDSKFAYLDHDARRFAGFVLSQLPGPQQNP